MFATKSKCVQQMNHAQPKCLLNDQFTNGNEFKFHKWSHTKTCTMLSINDKRNKFKKLVSKQNENRTKTKENIWLDRWAFLIFRHISARFSKIFHIYLFMFHVVYPLISSIQKRNCSTFLLSRESSKEKLTMVFRSLYLRILCKVNRSSNTIY